MHLFNVKFKEACGGLDFEEKCEDSDTICEAVFETKGKTCAKHCESLGFVCEDGWNDKSRTCAKDTDEASGCDEARFMQICRCITGRLGINYFTFLRIFLEINHICKNTGIFLMDFNLRLRLCKWLCTCNQIWTQQNLWDTKGRKCWRSDFGRSKLARSVNSC